MSTQHEHSKQFAAENWARLLSEDRQKSMPLAVFFKRTQPASHEVWLDFGAGPGYFSLPLAEKVSKVIVADISETMLEVCRQRANEAGLNNLEFLKITNAQLDLADESVDKIVMANVFHELDQPEKDLAELRRVLKPAGRLFLIDWRVMETEHGPPLDHRIAPESVRHSCEQAGFQFTDQWDDFEFHYFLSFQK